MGAQERHVSSGTHSRTAAVQALDRTLGHKLESRTCVQCGHDTSAIAPAAHPHTPHRAPCVPISLSTSRLAIR
eukprot:1475580-Prymnesium_polylepis.2